MEEYKIYNVAYNQRTTLNNLYKLIKERVAARCTLPNVNLSYHDFRAGDVRHSKADITKAKTILNYQPEYDIKQGLDEAMDWYVKSLR